jgi:hypothetical protein
MEIPLKEDETICDVCETPWPQAALERCRICFRYFCEVCTFKMRGVRFCSEGCAGYFMYGDDDAESDESPEE